MLFLTKLKRHQKEQFIYHAHYNYHPTPSIHPLHPPLTPTHYQHLNVTLTLTPITPSPKTHHLIHLLSTPRPYHILLHPHLYTPPPHPPPTFYHIHLPYANPYITHIRLYFFLVVKHFL